MGWTNCLLITKTIILDILIPVILCVTEYMFCVNTIISSSQYRFLNPQLHSRMTWFGIIMLLPEGLTIPYNLYSWITTKNVGTVEKFIGFWLGIPFFAEYLHCKILISICSGTPEDEWKRKQKEIKTRYRNLGPYLKCIPNIFIKYCIVAVLVIEEERPFSFNQQGSIFTFCTLYYAVLAKPTMAYTVTAIISHSSILGPDGETFYWFDEFGNSLIGLNKALMFRVILVISTLSSIYGISIFLINGPLKVYSQNKYRTYLINLLISGYVITQFFIKSFVYFQMTVLVKGFFGFYFNDIMTFVIVFTIHTVIPALMFIPSLVNYCGPGNVFKLLSTHLALLVLPFITDLVYGPIEGSSRIEENLRQKLTINRNFSWGKSIYYLMIMIGMYYFLYHDVVLFNCRPWYACPGYNNSIPNPFCKPYHAWCDNKMMVLFLVITSLSYLLFILILHELRCLPFTNKRFRELSLEQNILTDLQSQHDEEYEMVNTKNGDDA